MRILHTADWHIGQTLAGYSRENEHRAALRQLVRIVAEREVDALIVAGDIYDSQNPSGEAQRLLFETLVALHKARPSLAIVLTAGNHDAAGRLEAPSALLATIGTTVVGSVRRTEGRLDAARHLLPLRDATGRTFAEVLAVSYPTAACLPAFASDAGIASPIAAATQQLYDELAGAVRAQRSGAPLIVTGHLHVAGALESEGAERRILVGGQHAIPPDAFPADAAYVALGHLHKPQRIDRDTIRYSGSLFPLSATELAYEHSATLITLDNDTPRIEMIPLTRLVPFIRLPDRDEAPLDEIGDMIGALALDSALPIDQRPFIRIGLAREGLSTGFRAEIDRIVSAFPVRLIDIVLTPRLETKSIAGTADPLVRLADLQPADLFAQAFEREHGRAPDAAHRAAFHRVLADAGA